MTKFEYKYVRYTELQSLFRKARKSGKLPPGTDIARFIMQQWNEWGAEGWELVAVETTTVFGNTTEGSYYWKRAQ